MNNALNIIRDEAYAKGLEDGKTKWFPINKETPENKMLLLVNDEWMPTKLRGEPPPVKIGYYFSEEGKWMVFGASWQPTKWAEIPYPE